MLAFSLCWLRRCVRGWSGRLQGFDSWLLRVHAALIPDRYAMWVHQRSSELQGGVCAQVPHNSHQKWLGIARNGCEMQQGGRLRCACASRTFVRSRTRNNTEIRSQSIRC